MEITIAYNNLLDELDKGLSEHYNLYGTDAVHNDLSKRTKDLYDNLLKSIKSFGAAVEDEIIVKLNETEDSFIDGDLDLYIGKPL